MDYNRNAVNFTTKEYERQIKEEHNQQLMRWLTQVFLSNRQELCDFEIIVNGNKYLTHRLILSLFIPYLLTKCPPNCAGVQMDGIENFALETILTYCYTGRLDPNKSDFFPVLETATLLRMNDFVAKWCQSYEQTIEDSISKLMHKRRIAVMFGWTDKIDEINQSLDQMAKEKNYITLAEDLQKTEVKKNLIENKTIKDSRSKLESRENEIMEEITEQNSCNKSIPKPMQPEMKAFKEKYKSQSLGIYDMTSFSTRIDRQIQKNLDSFTVETKPADRLSKAKPEQTHKLLIDEDDKQYEETLRRFTKSSDQSISEDKRSGVKEDSKCLDVVEKPAKLEELTVKPKNKVLITEQPNPIQTKKIIEGKESIPQTKQKLEYRHDIKVSERLKSQIVKDKGKGGKDEEDDEHETDYYEADEKEEIELKEKEEKVESIAKPIDAKVSEPELYLFGEVFLRPSDEDQYVCERDFMSYIYKSKNGYEWQLYRKFVNHFRTSFTQFVSYKSDILLIGALSKVPKSKTNYKTHFIASKYCMKYIGGSKFKTFPAMTYSRTRHAVAVVNGVLYAIGGIRKLEAELESKSILLKINNTIEYYNQISAKWITLNKTLPIRVYSMAALEFNNQLWIIGGMSQNENENQNQIPINDIYAYDPKNDNIIKIRYKLPNACAFMSAIAVDTKLFVIGGKVSSDSQSNGDSLEITNEVWIFDSEDREWTRGPSLNCPRCKTCVIKRGSVIYAFGGVIDSTRSKCAIVETLDTSNLNHGWIRHEDLPIDTSGSKIVFAKSF